MMKLLHTFKTNVMSNSQEQLYKTSFVLGIFNTNITQNNKIVFYTYWYVGL